MSSFQTIGVSGFKEKRAENTPAQLKSHPSLFPTSPSAPIIYRALQAFLAFPYYTCVKTRIIHPEFAATRGCVLACTHLAHLEPACLSILFRRRIDWMARTACFQRPLWGSLLRSIDAIPTRQTGVPVRALRTAIARAQSGRMIGIFPEGGVAVGSASVCRAGPLKSGASFIAMAAGVPIVPVIVLNAHSLCRVRTWLPGRLGRVCVMFGKPVLPPACRTDRAAAPSRRAQRRQLTEALRQRYLQMYAELCVHHGVDDTTVP